MVRCRFRKINSGSTTLPPYAAERTGREPGGGTPLTIDYDEIGSNVPLHEDCESFDWSIRSDVTSESCEELWESSCSDDVGNAFDLHPETRDEYHGHFLHLEHGCGFCEIMVRMWIRFVQN